MKSSTTKSKKVIRTHVVREEALEFRVNCHDMSRMHEGTQVEFNNLHRNH